MVHEGAQVTKPTPPPIRKDRDNKVEISGVADGRGGRTHTDRLTGATQDALSEEAAMLVKDRRGIKAEAQVGRCRKKTNNWGEGGRQNICEDRKLSVHSEAKP